MNKSIFLLPIRSTLFILSFFFISIILKKNFSEINNLWSIIVSLCNIITIIILLHICKIEKINYFDMIKYKKGNTKIATVIFVSILTCIGFSGMYFAGFICYNKFPYMPIMMLEPISVILSIINIFILPITTTLAEDGLYLGIGVNQIENKYAAIILPAFFMRYSIVLYRFYRI